MPMRYHNRRVRNKIGEAVRLRRGELSLTQEQLAELAGVSLRTIQNTETGYSMVRPVTQGQIEKALGWEAGTINTLYQQAVAEEEGCSPDSVTSYAPEIEELLNHPALPEEGREVILRELERLHEEFAQKMSRAFRLTDQTEEPAE